MTLNTPLDAARLSILTDIIGGFSACRILCVGDVMMDRFRYGDVKRISPEAPVPVIRIAKETTTLGGAGNVVRNLNALGAKCAFVSIVGDDPAGTEIGKLLGKLEQVEAFLRVAPGRQTTIKTRYVSHDGHQMLRADRETSDPLASDIMRDIERDVSSQVASADAIILSDYGKGLFAGALAHFAIKAAKAAGKPVIVDPKGASYERYAGASVITPNRSELELAIGLSIESEAQIVEAANVLRRDVEAGAILVTRSGDGMTLVGEDGAQHMLAATREVTDVTGAGDTVIATFALALAAGASTADAAYLANAAAGVVVGRQGTAVVSAQDVTKAIMQRGLAHAEQKVVDRTSLLEQVKTWRESKLKVGFTNGCFDLLHPGHVSLLRQAREACDRLIVGLNSDASVKRLKGDSRPVQNETARAAVMASLATVDLVVIFGEDTPLDLIDSIRPDVLVKGADYAREQVVGGDMVESYGGRVVLADVLGPYSTTSTIAAMKSAR